MARTWTSLSFLYLLAINLFLHFTESATTHDTSHRQNLYSTDSAETTRLLFSHHDDPLAIHDKWTMLSDYQRKKWTHANNITNPYHHTADLLRITDSIRKTTIHVNINIQLVFPPHFVSLDHHTLISTYSSAMRAGFNGTFLNFTVSLAPEKLYQRVALHFRDADVEHSEAQGVSHLINQLSALLEQSALSLASLSVLYVIIHPKEQMSNSIPTMNPTLGSSRTAFVIYPITSSSSLSVAHLLTFSEHVAERVFSPRPLYFPIPLLSDMEVSVSAFTPGYELRAPWLDDFAWDDFEAVIRSHELPGQKIRFSSSQTNAECPRCNLAFHEIQDSSAENFILDAIKSLSHDAIPNSSWPMTRYHVHHVPNALHKQRTALDTFRLFIVDTVKIKQTNMLKRLERHALFTFPGTAVLIIRSSDPRAKLNLHSNLLLAFIAAVYGVVEPEFYLGVRRDLDGATTTSKTSDWDHSSIWPGKQSPVLRDIIVRNILRSVVERRLEQLEEIVDGMVYFEMEPEKSLDKAQVVQFEQRVNLMLLKLEQAQLAVSERHDCQLALYLASSTEHDMKSIRAVFDIDDEKRMMKRFRDPTVRCHFSRLKKEAIRASEIIETTYRSVTLALIILVNIFLSLAFTRVVMLKLAVRKSSRKLE